MEYHLRRKLRYGWWDLRKELVAECAVSSDFTHTTRRFRERRRETLT